MHSVATTIPYRADIDGLRAVAVLAVMTFHYRLPVPGGFLGVDAFFVISGYLITQIIRRDLAAGEFSLLKFYERRIRRIVPALVFMLTATLAAGFALLDPENYAETAVSGLSALAAVSNIYFWKNTGYFDQAAELLPFLHTWSLGIEEQFYLLWPLALLLVSRRPTLTLVVLGGGILASLAAAIWGALNSPTAAFYLLPTRAWELAVGCLIAFANPVATALRSRVAGAVLIFGSFALISDDWPMPTSALPAVLGTALLVRPALHVDFVASALARGAAIGRMSYSLYLWHWPILVLYLHYNRGEFPLAPELAVLAAAAFVMGYLSWRFVELPFRRSPASTGKIYLRGTALAGVAAASGLFVVMSDGAAWRLSRDVANHSRTAMWEWSCPRSLTIDSEEYCSFGTDWETSAQKGVLWGDSHAEHLAPLLDQLGKSAGISFIRAGWCSPIAGGIAIVRIAKDPTYEVACRKSWTRVVSLLERHPEIETAVLSATWQGRLNSMYSEPGVATTPSGQQALFRTALVEVLERLRQPSRHVFLVADTPSLPSRRTLACALEPPGLARSPCTEDDRRGFSTSAFREHRMPSWSIMRSVAAEYETFATLIDPMPGLCEGPYCHTTAGGEFFYRDRGHLRRDLSASAAEELTRKLGLQTIASTRMMAGSAQ